MNGSGINKEEYERVKARIFRKYMEENFKSLLDWLWGDGWQEILQEAFKRSGLESFWDDPDKVIQKAKEIVNEEDR